MRHLTFTRRSSQYNEEDDGTIKEDDEEDEDEDESSSERTGTASPTSPASSSPSSSPAHASRPRPAFRKGSFAVADALVSKYFAPLTHPSETQKSSSPQPPSPEQPSSAQPTSQAFSQGSPPPIAATEKQGRSVMFATTAIPSPPPSSQRRNKRRARPEPLAPITKAARLKVLAGLRAILCDVSSCNAFVKRVPAARARPGASTLQVVKVALANRALGGECIVTCIDHF